MEFVKNGAALVQQQIEAACLSGSRMTTVRGNLEIETTIRIPGDFTLLLENCHLRMADNTFCNMFTNASCQTEAGRTPEGADRNITIRGIGRVILDGGSYNGLSEFNSCKDGNPHISVNNLLLFANVDGFRIENLHIRNQRWWAMNFIYCRNGYIGGMDFLADCTCVDAQGVRYTGLKTRETQNYSEVYVKNADGIDLRCGCHDITIENITGFTEDDTIAITGLPGKLETQLYPVRNLSPDIYNVIIRNVNSAAFCANVRLLNQSGVKLYNILVDGVMDSSKESPCLERGSTGVRLGDVYLYGSRHATAEETYNITVRNVYSRAGAAMRIAGAMKDCLFDNIRVFDGGETVIENNATVDISGFIRNTVLPE